ncbi:hypothetical protein PTTG_00915 [Puccinia triticina 1-1 BBBD Race 1]|uniref:Chromatin modification-related protein n=2 Tax=Puccinia triticina TaxID=208348 RepID=A0A180GLG2_PUCT1|nr:uncharacterized protein PtA15_13A59 [Puccinia triticina]OAV93309.1 hypothetical protein PTTG_00915 [Puccinia triticina 1-1 BBBD Race 1]WAQ90660.1 hypothetical protein PtA15_13A59 [Puccinia triticina]WAR60815.1 hypothetical protein PtB15_13B61 [Puccinia triticina]
MVAKPKKRLASGEGNLSRSPSAKLASPKGHRKQPKPRALQSQQHSLPQALIDPRDHEGEEEEQQQSNPSSPSNNHIIPDQRPSLSTGREEHDAEENQEEESQEMIKEREARERIFDEFKDEYVDIIDQIPLDLNRKYSCITELEESLEECRRELHEDLIAYTNFAKEIQSTSGPEPMTGGPAVEAPDDIANRLRALAQPALWGVVPIPPISSSTSSTLPEHLKTLLIEISGKITRIQELSHDKLNLAESVYLALDRQLKRLDADLETYQDLEDQDAQTERHHREAVNDNTERDDQSNEHLKQPHPDQTSLRELQAEQTPREPQLTPRKSPSRNRSLPATPASTRRNRQTRLAEETEELPVEPSGSFNSADNQMLYCYCQQVAFGDMLGCDNPNCQGGQWFHLECAGLAELPKESDTTEWFCHRCLAESSPSKHPPSSASNLGKKKKKKTGRRN